MLRDIGVGAGVAAVILVAGYFWIKDRDAEIYEKAKNEIARTLQDDAAKKERAAIDAENSVSPTPESPEALAALCAADPDCRDKEAKK